MSTDPDRRQFMQATVALALPLLTAGDNAQSRIRANVLSNARDDRLTNDQWAELDRLADLHMRMRAPFVSLLLDAENMLDMTQPEQRVRIGTNGALLPAEYLGDYENEEAVKKMSLPLPYSHKDFTLQWPDTVFAEAAFHRVAELVEQWTVGVIPAFEVPGMPPVYGLLNSLHASSFTVVNPQRDGWDGRNLLNDVYLAIQQLMTKRFYGPYCLLHGDYWQEYLTRDYQYPPGPDGWLTVQERLLKIDSLMSVQWTPAIKDSTLVLVQLTPDAVRMVIVKRLGAVCWGKDYKAVAVIVPQIRSDFYGNSGIAVGKVKQ